MRDGLPIFGRLRDDTTSQCCDRCTGGGSQRHLLIIIAAILVHTLPLSASEALNRPSEGAHELGFWLLLLLSLPLWLLGTWLAALAIVRESPTSGRTFRRVIWGSALALTLLAIAAGRNALGFGDLFVPV
jgi:hypothetical protein